jgi:amino acid transporter
MSNYPDKEKAGKDFTFSEKLLLFTGFTLLLSLLFGPLIIAGLLYDSALGLTIAFAASLTCFCLGAFFSYLVLSTMKVVD